MLRKISTKRGGEPKTFEPSWSLDDGSYGPANSCRGQRRLCDLSAPPCRSDLCGSGEQGHQVGSLTEWKGRRPGTLIRIKGRPVALRY
jgi:hypothetical protein